MMEFLSLPLGESVKGGAIVGGEEVHYYVEVTGQAREAVAGNIDAAIGAGVEQNIVEDGVARAAVFDIQRPARVRSHQDGVVDDDIVFRPSRAIDHEQRNAAGMVVVKEVVFDDGALHAVQVNRRAPRGPIVMDNIPGDERSGDKPGAALAQI